jgi:light-independent protochlorophyllide reductase subunit L
MRLAEELLAGIEPCLATPMKDRDIFDFLGFE